MHSEKLSLILFPALNLLKLLHKNEQMIQHIMSCYSNIHFRDNNYSSIYFFSYWKLNTFQHLLPVQQVMHKVHPGYYEHQ